MESNIQLYDYQVQALNRLRSGAILFGDVGSGKTLTGLSYYLKNYSAKDLYVITTAKKRDSGDWEEEAGMLGITDLTVDSWNNVTTYKDVTSAFFIFDEQRVVGYGKWSKTFIKIAKQNLWILLSGTPGDTWSDYIPVFIANGYFKNKTEFNNMHVEFDRFARYPKIKRYHNVDILEKLRDRVLVPMTVDRHTKRHRIYVENNFDINAYKKIVNERWDIFKDEPIQDAGVLTQVLRRLVATDPDRIWRAHWIMDAHDRIIVFYNYNYELDILKEQAERCDKPYFQWNGHKHEDLPEEGDWIYLVQYTAGAEGWNCTTANTIMFYSLNYSYKLTEQAEGRIDRVNTPFTDLEYFYMTSKSKIDKAVMKAIRTKKRFNETRYGKGESLFLKNLNSKRN